MTLKPRNRIRKSMLTRMTGLNHAVAKLRLKTSGGETAGQRWFVAAHSWDLIAARKEGFRTAWVAHEERDPVTAVFGEFDVYAKDLKECFEKIVAASK